MNGQASDAELIARARAGEVEAYGELYRRHIDLIFRYLRSRVEDPHDAEDLAETVFLRAFRSLDRYRERGWPFSAFLYQIARNALVDHYRGRRAETDLEKAEDMLSVAPSLEEGVVRSEDLESLRRALASLAPDYQEVIRLRVLLGLPTQTVARWMDRSEGAIRVLQYRALEALRKRLVDER